MTSLLILVALVLLVWCSLNWKAMDLDRFYNDKIVFFGHRGERYRAPENTMPSYVSAIHNGFKAIELDVRLSKEGNIVCSHNIDLERETTGTGFIDELSFDELLHINAGNAFPRSAQAKIPLLEEVLEQLPADILINIEIKTDSIFDFGTVRKILLLIKNDKIKQKILVSSFNPIIIRFIKLMSKKTPTGFIYEHEKHFNGVYIARPDCLHPNAEFVDDKLIKFCKKRGIRINTWTINNPYARDWLIEKGVNGIITDNVKLLV